MNQPAEVAGKKPKNPRVRVLGLLLVFVVVLVAGIAGIRYLLYSSVHEMTDDAEIDADIVAVTSKISERVAALQVDTNQYVHRGQVLVVLDHHDEQQRYDQALANYTQSQAQAKAAGQTVALTADQVQAQVQQGNGSVDQARAGITNSQAQAQASNAEVSVAQAGVATALAQLQSAQAVLPSSDESERRALADLRRTQALVATGDAPASELDAAQASEASARSGQQQARANIAVAQANVAAAREKLRSQQAAAQATIAAVALQQANLVSAQGKLQEVTSPYRVASQQSDAQATRAQVATQAAQVEEARNALSYTVIRAPVDGYVGEKSIEVGATVAPGQTLLTLVPIESAYITANYKETQIGHIRPGQKVDISVDAYHGHLFRGHVAALGPASENTYSLVPAQNATGNFVKVTQRLPVRIVVDEGVDAEHPLRVGMSVETAVAVKE